MRILGLDPSLTCTGWAIIEDGKVIKSGTIKTSKKDGSFIERINILRYRLIKEAITGSCCNHAAIEDVFVNRRNIKTSIQLAKLHGAMILIVFSSGIPINNIEVYDNRVVKQTITRNGNATKEQVLKMVQLQSGYKGKQLDESDAIAVALTCERKIQSKRS
jgi:crossover junction endodeoxyribonuclease RuvC